MHSAGNNFSTKSFAIKNGKINSFSLKQGHDNEKIASTTQSKNSIYHFLHLELFWLWMLDYTAGVPIHELASRLPLLSSMNRGRTNTRVMGGRLLYQPGDETIGRTKIQPFDDRRSQQFLCQGLYEKTLANSHALLRVQLNNRKLAESAGDISLAHQFLYLENFWIWLLDYTAGVPIEELAPRLSDIVDKFAQWNEADQIHQREILSQYPEYGPYQYRAAPNFGDLADYEDTLQLLSIAILLRDQRSVSRIIRILRSHRGQDGLFEQLISAYVEDAMMLDTCVLGKPYDTLLQTVYEEDESSARNLIKKYLKQWYPAMKNHPRWYDGHLKISDEGYAPYYGYWGFEAGATVFLLDLDDSQIDHLVYPKDLVAYARQLREKGRYTSEVAWSQPR